MSEFGARMTVEIALDRDRQRGASTGRSTGLREPLQTRESLATERNALLEEIADEISVLGDVGGGGGGDDDFYKPKPRPGKRFKLPRLPPPPPPPIGPPQDDRDDQPEGDESPGEQPTLPPLPDVPELPLPPAAPGRDRQPIPDGPLFPGEQPAPVPGGPAAERFLRSARTSRRGAKIATITAASLLTLGGVSRLAGGIATRAAPAGIRRAILGGGASAGLGSTAAASGDDVTVNEFTNRDALAAAQSQSKSSAGVGTSGVEDVRRVTAPAPDPETAVERLAFNSTDDQSGEFTTGTDAATLSFEQSQELKEAQRERSEATSDAVEDGIEEFLKRAEQEIDQIRLSL